MIWTVAVASIYTWFITFLFNLLEKQTEEKKKLKKKLKIIKDSNRSRCLNSGLNPMTLRGEIVDKEMVNTSELAPSPACYIKNLCIRWRSGLEWNCEPV